MGGLRDVRYMPDPRPHLTPSRIRMFFGLALLAIFIVEIRTSAPLSAKLIPAEPAVVLAREVPVGTFAQDSFDSIVRTDPLRALTMAREDHERTIRDYTCTFVKQELLPSGMSEEQTIAVQFRQQPYSVHMHWLKNPGKAERVIYVAGRWVDANAERNEERDLAVCQPGPVARLFVKSLKQPIRGDLAKESSRRCIDEFGFGRSFELLIKYSLLAQQRGELKLEYKGESQFAGRPTVVIERHLPYIGPDGDYPDRIAIIHLDKEWRIPVSVRCYADDARTQLLGRYEYSDVKLAAGLSDAQFEPTNFGM